jgi:hypothetical protein
MKDNINIIVTDYFHDGRLEFVDPETAHQYDATQFNIGRKSYNLLDENDVVNLPIPKFHSPDSLPDVTNNEDYILRMVASRVRKQNHPLSILILHKANNMMLVSNVGWLKEDYLRLVKWMYQDGMIEDAEDEEKRINALHIDGHISFDLRENTDRMLNIALHNAKELETDYIDVSCGGSRSKNEALFGSRIYSISGNDQRLDKLPIPFPECNCSFYPFFLFTTMYDNKMKPIADPIEYSRRDHVDDRTEEEIQSFNQWQEKINLPNTLWKQEKQYYYLKFRFPNVCPKSKAAFDRLIQNDHQSYEKLVYLLPKSYQ